MSGLAESTLYWQLVDTTGSSDIPAPRTYATLVSNSNCLYLFGGYGESKGRYNCVYEYNIHTHQWRQIISQQAIAEIPKPVYLHSAVMYQHQMLVFGGNNSRECNELYAYDLVSFQWQKFPPPSIISTTNYPPPRYG